MSDLRARVIDFLNRELPDELKPKYAPDNITDMLMACYANGKPFDAEMLELLNICATYSSGLENSQTEECKEYFRESAAIIDAMRLEMGLL